MLSLATQIDTPGQDFEILQWKVVYISPTVYLSDAKSMIIMQNSSYVNANSTEEDNEFTTDWSEGNVLKEENTCGLYIPCSQL